MSFSSENFSVVYASLSPDFKGATGKAGFLRVRLKKDTFASIYKRIVKRDSKEKAKEEMGKDDFGGAMLLQGKILADSLLVAEIVLGKEGQFFVSGQEVKVEDQSIAEEMVKAWIDATVQKRKTASSK